MDGDEVVVTNGIYAAGSAVTPGHACSNRVAILANITVRSVEGPASTIILGKPDPGTGDTGTGAVRGVYMSAGSLIGFTVSNGYTMNTGVDAYDTTGGGVLGGQLVYGRPCSASNCVIVCNSAVYGGGAAYGTVYCSTIRGNNASGDGGGAAYVTAHRSTIRDNNASGNGGGIVGNAYNTLLVNNRAQFGGGAYFSTLANCTVYSNYARGGCGIWSFEARNCIIWNNSNDNYVGVTMSCSCSKPLSSGTGNITNDPMFVAPETGDFHLRPGSPCINAGDNQYAVMPYDLDGNPRIFNGIVDMGAYEYSVVPEPMMTPDVVVSIACIIIAFGTRKRNRK